MENQANQSLAQQNINEGLPPNGLKGVALLFKGLPIIEHIDCVVTLIVPSIQIRWHSKMENARFVRCRQYPQHTHVAGLLRAVRRSYRYPRLSVRSDCHNLGNIRYNDQLMLLM